MTLSGATTQYHNATGNDGNKGVLSIPKSSSITEASLSDCLVSYQGHSLGESYLFAETQSVYSTALANWSPIIECPIQDTHSRSLTPQQRCSRCILLPQPTGFRLLSVIYQDTHSRSLTPQQRCNRCILLSQPTGLRLLSVISGHSFEESYPSAEGQSVYSTVPADLASL